jgi:hypothetical protein
MEENMNAIIFESNTGYTKKYAELLSSLTGQPAYERKGAKKQLEHGGDIIYMGWLCAGRVKGYSKAAKAYYIKAVCAIGMGSPDDKQTLEVKKRYQMNGREVFYLQGGFDMKNDRFQPSKESQ